MDDMTLYGELNRFLTSRLWIEALRPRLQDWADSKTAAMQAAKSPADLWDARTAANTSKEALELLDGSLDGLRSKLMDAVKPPPSAMG